MTAPKHTPAPWRVEDGHDRGIFLIIGPRANCRRNEEENTWELATIDNSPFPEMTREDRANAKLMAASPQLFDAVEEAINWLEQAFAVIHDPKGQDEGAKGLLEQLRAARKKAVGR